MCSPRRNETKLLILLALAFLTLCSPQRSYACSVPPSDEWFVEDFLIPPLDAPEGVTIRVVDGANDEWNGYPRDSIEIRNSSSTPLYLLGRSYEAHGNPAFQYEPLPVPIPKGRGPINKVVEHQAFHWGIDWEAIGNTDVDMEDLRFEWITMEGSGDAIRLNISYNRIDSGMGYVTDLEPLNQTGDHRPDMVTPPEPQSTELSLVYGTQLITVPVTVSYRINETYDPTSVARSARACDMLPLLLPIGGIVIGGMLVLAIIGIGFGIVLLQRRAQM